MGGVMRLRPGGGACRRWIDHRLRGKGVWAELSGYMREFMRADLLAVGQHDRAENCVLELAHVARPAIGRQHGESIGIDAAHALALFGRNAREEMAGEFGDVLT